MKDEELIKKYLGGSESAGRLLVTRHQGAIYRLVHRMSKNTEDARDLTQSAFLKAFESLKAFRGESGFKTWLYRIAVNQALNYYRGPERQYDEFDELKHPAGGNGQGGFGELEHIEGRERKRALKGALKKLPARQSLALTLRAFEGLSIKEAASVMGCSEGAVKAHYHSAVKKLKKTLKEDGHEIRT